ncbi:MAG: hypothetical protein PUC65_04455 [Clostridiales bacterium]|nr:hypothetical protein [Clostridiales bacterium]
MYLDGWIIDTTDEFHGKYKIEDGTVGIADGAFTYERFSEKGYEKFVAVQR